jgi:hypothetical protein
MLAYFAEDSDAGMIMIQVLTGALLMSQMLADLTDDSDAGISY